MLFSAHGTALLDLAEVYNTSVEEISYTITTRAVGAIVAGIFGRSNKLLENKLKRNRQFASIIEHVVLKTCQKDRPKTK